MFSDVITVFSLSNQKSKSKNSDMIGERQSWQSTPWPKRGVDSDGSRMLPQPPGQLQDQAPQTLGWGPDEQRLLRERGQHAAAAASVRLQMKYQT